MTAMMRMLYLKNFVRKKKQFASKSRWENYCCVHQPLLNIPLDHIILDELHLMLLFTDVLIIKQPHRRCNEMG